ncbi:MAG: hypothetical protein ABR961_14480, partial [Thermoanaerobaculaceae bacterium]
PGIWRLRYPLARVGGHFILKPYLGRQTLSHTPPVAIIIRTNGQRLDSVKLAARVLVDLGLDDVAGMSSGSGHAGERGDLVRVCLEVAAIRAATSWSVPGRSAPPTPHEAPSVSWYWPVRYACGNAGRW